MNGFEQTRGWIGFGALLLGTVATAPSCLRVNDDHCMFNGGDVACDGAYCVAAVGSGSSALAAVGANGCSEPMPGLDDPGVAYVQYGLVADEEDLRAVLERESVSSDCSRSIDVPLLEGVEPDLRSRERARRSKASLTPEQRQNIHELNEAIGRLVEMCSVEQTTGSTTTDEETTTGETDSESATTTGEPECMEHADCMEPARPLCGPEQACVPCIAPSVDGAAGCAEKDPEQPLVCVTDGLWAGHCRECTAQATDACAGVCDTENNVCLPCTAHDQCGEAACNLFTGACLPEDEDAVVHVGPGQEFATIGAAVASVEAGAERTIIVHPTDYNESVTVDQGRVIAFLAVEIGGEAEVPRWVRTFGSSPQLTVGDATVLMDGMQVSGNISLATTGLLLDGGRAWVDRSRIINNDGGGILAQQDVEGNAAELVLRNCFVGGDINDMAALEVNGSSASVLYTTLGGGFGTATALTCDAMATVDVRNALLVARTTTDEIMCDATYEHSAAEIDLEGTNVGLGDMSTNWFASYAAGNFHVSGMEAIPPAAINTAAQWQAGDPPTDIDGAPRPSTDGTSDFAGADVP